MAVKTSKTGARSWATATDWVGDACPVDNVDSAVIAADCQMLMNQDQSAYTGLLGVTISGHATTPGMLYWKDGTSGYLKIKTGYNLLGTSGTAKGRLLANSDGTWGNTGSLAFADKAVIDLGATSSIVAQYLDIALYCYQPTTKYLRTFGVRHTVTGSAASDTLTKLSHGLANTTRVMVMGSDIPSPLEADTVYYVVNTATDTFKLSYVATGTAINLTSDGSGTIEVYTGAASSADPVSVFEDVSAQTGWTATDGHDRVAICSYGADQQRLTIVTLDTDHIHLSAALDSLQYPGARIYLSSRNVSIRSAMTTAIAAVLFTSNAACGAILQCEIVNTASSGATTYGYGVQNASAAITMSGTIMGFNIGLYACSYAIVSGNIIVCGQGMSQGTGSTVSGDLAGCITYGIYVAPGCTFTGVIYGSGTGISAGNYNTSSGVIVLCAIGVSSGVGFTVGGIIKCCGTGVSGGVGHVITASLYGETYGITGGGFHKISSPIYGNSYGFYYASMHTFTGKLGYDASDNSAVNIIDIKLGVTDGGITKIICLGAKLQNPVTFESRNGVGYNGQERIGIFSENHLRVLDASYLYRTHGDVIKNTTTVRSGGAVSSLEVVPLSNCATVAPLLFFEWTELSVPASAQNKSVYIRANDAWSVYPTADELYIEAEYISNGTTFATTVVKSTAVLDHASNWIQFSIPEFTPAVAGHVRYLGYLKKYEASRKIYVDNMLVTA